VIFGNGKHSQGLFARLRFENCVSSRGVESGGEARSDRLIRSSWLSIVEAKRFLCQMTLNRHGKLGGINHRNSKERDLKRDIGTILFAGRCFGEVYEIAGLKTPGLKMPLRRE
jgi:hypothetical protein